MNKENTEWDQIILPKRGLFDLRLKQVWRYRDLLWLLVRRDFISFYKQTILGPLWFVIQPLFTIGIYVFIFGKLAKISTDSIPLPLFYLTGITAWTYFSDCLLKTANVFRENASIFGKVYFPRLIMPISVVISSLVKFVVQLILLAVLMLYYKITGTALHFTGYIFAFPLFVIMMACLGLGLGLIVSSLTTKYRDFILFLSFGISFMMYASPVVYPLSALPPKFALVLSFNPMATVIEGMRMALFGQGTIDSLHIISAVVVTIVVLFTGAVVYTKVEKNFIDTI